MKKSLLKNLVLVLLIVLISAGCNSTKKTLEQDSMANQPQNTAGNQSVENETVNTTVSEIYTIADVQKANTPENCWTAIDGKVYNLTAWINKHPGGDKNILKLCGIDGSLLYNGKHGGQEKPEKVLEGFSIGILK